MTDTPTEPADAGDEDGAAPAELVELHQVLAWEQAVKEAEQDG